MDLSLAILNLSWAILGHIGLVLGGLGVILRLLGPFSDSQDRFQFGCQKVLLDDSCTHVHCLEVILGLSGPRLGRLGPVLGKSWGGLGRVLGGLEPVRGTIRSWSEWVLAGKLSAVGGLGGQQQARHLFQRTVSHCQATFMGFILFC